MATVQIVAQLEVAADPASVALLLAGPRAAEYWPGVSSVHATGEPLLVAAEVPGRGLLTALVSTRPPVRTPTAFVFDFTVRPGELPELRGRLWVDHATGDRGVGHSHLALSVDYQGEFPERLRILADGFLRNVRAAAERRSRAA
ncbi:MAG: hypothetical protein ACYCO3_09830 [Mycobacteriales bacterium]